MGRVLIVDDSSFMRGSLKFIAEKAGHEVVGTGKNGTEALERYKELRPDVVTLDILMEGMDGMAALRALRREDPTARIVMVTALGQDEKQEEAKQLGAAGYIRKPFDPQQIADEIERVLGGA